MEKDIAAQEQSLNETTNQRQRYLEAVLDSYLQCLVLSSDHDLVMFRLITVWFENVSIGSYQKLEVRWLITVKTLGKFRHACVAAALKIQIFLGCI